MRKLVCALYLSLVFASCVEDYKIPQTVIANYESEIVIQGRILSGEKSIIYISQTLPMGTVGVPETSVLNAKVKIVGQNGYQSELAEYDIENDYYAIETPHLTDNTQYALQVEADGETYQSEFLTILDTPEIDEVTYKEREDGITIHVSSQNKNENSRHYLWSYEEDWEFTAYTDFLLLGTFGHLLYNHSTYGLLTKYDNPYYYCWNHNESKNIHIYTTKNLNQNAVKDVQLLHIPIDDARISYIYSILVKQCSLSDEAYSYYNSLKKYSEQSSGLFTPMPFELEGNVKCVSNPDIKAKGYVLASSIKTKRIFIYESNFKDIYSTYRDAVCNTQTSWEAAKVDSHWHMSWNNRMNLEGAVILSPNNQFLDDGDEIYSRGCLDCRNVEGATKKRPDFWPNDHE